MLMMDPYPDNPDPPTIKYVKTESFSFGIKKIIHNISYDDRYIVYD